MNASADIRWKQRFQNFERAFGLLREAVAEGTETLSQLEREGVIQRFEFTFELAWKTIKDYLDEQGVGIPMPTPRQVLKAAFGFNLVADGDVWMAMLDTRNACSHMYDAHSFQSALASVVQRYVPALSALHDTLRAARDAHA